ncbi:hypothetical protein BJ742DRAFT_829221 [Cladochytrium replicatum]|nr:hypothetical protein BJ742DRAFT_829221 [Cladochytrium replicatum]
MVIGPATITVMGKFLNGYSNTFASSSTCVEAVLEPPIDWELNNTTMLMFVYFGIAMAVACYFSQMFWIITRENQTKVSKTFVSDGSLLTSSYITKVIAEYVKKSMSLSIGFCSFMLTIVATCGPCILLRCSSRAVGCDAVWQCSRVFVSMLIGAISFMIIPPNLSRVSRHEVLRTRFLRNCYYRTYP